ncbi:hypothetical protein [Prevotella sp. KH2C16]|uniref:hypothetical protein n=1 Tax=Prevotella sp. KH2C16 TaxID=1855325 RepID=UPI0008DEB1F0|nr:hypothetical protein [Prevotella sp. KH2C16]SFG53753.1 hypothetical protein SAMN05216383_11942 [Prevotella sp. KH2C16]
MKRNYIEPQCQARAYASSEILAASDPDAVVVDPTNPGEGGASGAHSKEYEDSGVWGD